MKNTKINFFVKHLFIIFVLHLIVPITVFAQQTILEQEVARCKEATDKIVAELQKNADLPLPIINNEGELYKSYLDSPEVLEKVKQASELGKVLVVYADDGLHEDILSLGIKDEQVIVTGQYGQHPTVAPQPGVVLPKVGDVLIKLARGTCADGILVTREEWIEEFERSKRQCSTRIDAHAMVSQEKLEDLKRLTDKCTATSWKPYFASTCWTYSETTWNEWVLKPEPKTEKEIYQHYKNPPTSSEICNEVNNTFSGNCSGLSYVCANLYCFPSKSSFKECLKKQSSKINDCIKKNQSCLNSQTICEGILDNPE